MKTDMINITYRDSDGIKNSSFWYEEEARSFVVKLKKRGVKILYADAPNFDTYTYVMEGR